MLLFAFTYIFQMILLKFNHILWKKGTWISFCLFTFLWSHGLASWNNWKITHNAGFKQHAERVLTISPRQADLPLDLMNLIYYLLKGQVKDWHFFVCRWRKAGMKRFRASWKWFHRASWNINFLCTLSLLNNHLISS